MSKIKEVFSESKEKTLEAKKTEFLGKLKAGCEKTCEALEQERKEYEEVRNQVLEKIKEIGQAESLVDFKTIPSPDTLASNLMEAEIQIALVTKKLEIAKSKISEFFED